MGLDLAAADPSLNTIYETASSVLGFDLKKIIEEKVQKKIKETA